MIIVREIVDCFKAGAYTVLILNSSPPNEWKKFVRIGNIEYETVIPYDIPNSIGVKGHGDFIGKTVEFVY